jgi:pimeloyl-ACP methyl ester carboxylesterase
MAFKKHQTLINGIKTFYWEGNKDQKKVVVLLHGFPGNHKVVIDMARNFKNFRVIIPDLPACGESEPLKEEHILKNYVKWLDNFLANLLLAKKVVLIGYSFGSRVALTFCQEYEEKIEKLVLITPVVKADSLIARIALLEYEIAEVLPDFLKKTWLNNKVYHTASNMIIFKSASKKRREKLIEIDKKETSHLFPRANIELFNEFSKSRPISVGKKINTKALLIACDKDEVATVKTVKELLGRFAEAKVVIIKNSGHIVPAERPQKTARVILDWIQKK